MSFNSMAAVSVCIDFGAQENNPLQGTWVQSLVKEVLHCVAKKKRYLRIAILAVMIEHSGLVYFQL